MKNEGAPAISTHRIYGLTVQSDIFLPELQAVDCKTVPDIIVRQNSLPSPVSGVEHDKRSYLDGNAGRLWLDLPDIMRMEITDGHTIMGEKLRSFHTKSRLRTVFCLCLTPPGRPSHAGLPSTQYNPN